MIVLFLLLTYSFEDGFKFLINVYIVSLLFYSEIKIALFPRFQNDPTLNSDQLIQHGPQAPTYGDH